jgi:GTPase SAR1 family protein
MFDTDQFKKEIEAKLRGVSRDKCLVFAVRSALRVLPLLAMQNKELLMAGKAREAFWFWPSENKNQHLLAIFTSSSYAIEYLLTKKCVETCVNAAYAASDNAESAAKAAACDATASSVAVAVSAAAYATAADAEATIAAVAADAAYAYANTDSSAYVIADNTSAIAYAVAISSAISVAEASAIAAIPAYVDSIIEDIHKDLASLEKTTVKTFLQQPLSSKNHSEHWQQLIADFKTDALSLNAGFEVWLDWYDDRLKGKPIDLELMEIWNDIPEEIQEQGILFVNAYIKSRLQKVLTQPLNRVRAIFLGDNDVGKTALIQTLFGEPIVETETKMVAGIDIRNLIIPDTEITSHLWDFDEQVIAQASYKFFLRPACLYVLVLNTRNDMSDTEQAEYWLTQLKDYSENTRVMIVGNKADQTKIHLNMEYLLDKYSCLTDFYSLSCTQAQTRFKPEFERFQQDFYLQLQKVGIHQTLLSREQFSIFETLHYYIPESNFLSQREFIGICVKHGFSTEGLQNRDWILAILDKLGIVIYFPQLSYLEEYLLNPRWLTHGVNALISKRMARISLQDVNTILHEKQIRDENNNILNYPAAECRFLLNTMQEYKLCNSLFDEANILMILQFLPIEPPDILAFEKTDALRFEFVFTDFLPDYIIPELIADFHKEIVNSIAWKYGLLIQNKNYQAQALLEINYQQKILAIWLQGEDAKDYLGFLNNELFAILDRMKLARKTWLYLPLSSCVSDDKTVITSQEKIPYSQILAFAHKNKSRYISETGLEYDLKQVTSNEMIVNIESTDDELNPPGEKTSIFYIMVLSLVISGLLILFPMLLFKLQMEIKEALKYSLYFLAIGSSLYFVFFKFHALLMDITKRTKKSS